MQQFLYTVVAALSARAASATACQWLPAEAAINPRLSSSADSVMSLLNAPRTIVERKHHSVSITVKTILGVGSRSATVNIPGLAEVGFLTNYDALKLERVPGSMIVIGGGYIGRAQHLVQLPSTRMGIPSVQAIGRSAATLQIAHPHPKG